MQSTPSTRSAVPHVHASWTAAALVAIGVWLIQTLGWLSAVEGPLYDFCVRTQAAMTRTEPQVLLVHVSYETAYQDEQALLEMVERLRTLGARQFGFAFQPGSAWDGLAAVARQDQNLVLGREPQPDRSDPRQLWVPPLDPRDSDLPTGIVVLPSDALGVYRRQARVLNTDKTSRPLLETVLAQQALGHDATPTNDYGIAFRGAAGSLPHVNESQVLQDEIISELVSGRTVLFGLEPNAIQPRLTTPTATVGMQMSALEFHGHALNTLLTQRPIHVLSSWASLLLLVASALAAVLLFQRCTMRWALIGYVAFCVGNVAVAVGVMTAFRCWLPCAHIGLVQMACLALIFERKFGFWNSTVSRLFLDLSLNLRRRRWQSGFFTSAEPWPQVVSFIHQTLNLNRLIILELPPAAYHVREVHAFNCRLTDVDERRRDYRRYPFSQAVDSKQPVRLDERRPFLKNMTDDEQQLLVPLVFGGELFGFFALGIAKENLESLEDFDVILQSFADQVAELLYRRRCVLADEARDESLVNRVMRIPEESVYRELVHATQLLERRLTRLENMFERSKSATAVYDLFGRLVMINDQMRTLLQNDGIVPSELTTVDLVATLTGREVASARQLLRTVVVDKARETLPAKLKNRDGAFLLNVRPLRPSGTTANEELADEPAPFQLLGVVCELDDRSSFVEMSRLKDQLTQSLGNTLRNDLAAVDMAASLLVGDGVAATERRNYSELIHTRVERAVDVLEECQQFLASEIDDDGELCFPITINESLEDSIENVREIAELRGINIDGEVPEMLSHVLAAPKLLPRAFAAGFQLLLSDARDGSEIKYQVQQQAATIVVTLHNHGFGLPPEQLREVLDQQQTTNVDELRRIREVTGWLRDWSGELVVGSEIGTGITLQYQLKRFN